MLCMRSASFTMMTRMSRTIANSILRKLSACASWAVLDLDLIELADAVDQFGDNLAEHPRHPRFCGRRVFNNIVQDRRHQGVGIESQVGEDVGDRDRVRDVRFARYALLTLMFFRAEVVGFAHPLHLRGR